MMLSSCQKENLAPVEQEEAAKEETISFAVSGTLSGTINSPDSIYVVQACPKGHKKSETKFDSLPISIEGYLDSEYSGYTGFKAFKIVNSQSNISQAFVVIIKFNEKPVALRFDADGSFVKVLELREGKDLKGKGWHLGGWFEHRNGLQKDTLALNYLDAQILLYLKTTYSTDTLIHAVKNRDGSIIVLSQNNEIYATVFTAKGTFVKRTLIPNTKGKTINLEYTALSSDIQAYLNSTYPGFVLKKAVEIKQNNLSKGYLIFIDANLTKYVIRFDASSKVITSVVIR